MQTVDVINRFDTINGNTLYWCMIIVGILWLLCLNRAVKDAIARSDNGWFIFITVLLIIFLTPVFGLPVYISIRPIGYKRDKTPRRDMIELSWVLCGNCWALQSITHQCCTKCWETLVQVCRECSQKHSSSFDYCDVCWAPNIEK